MSASTRTNPNNVRRIPFPASATNPAPVVPPMPRTAPYGAVHAYPIAPTPVTQQNLTFSIPRRLVHTLAVFAVIFAFVLGVLTENKLGAHNINNTPGHVTNVSTVTGAPNGVAPRMPNDSEIKDMETALKTHTLGCHYVWNTVTLGYAVICGEPYSG